MEGGHVAFRELGLWMVAQISAATDDDSAQPVEPQSVGAAPLLPPTNANAALAPKPITASPPPVPSHAKPSPAAPPAALQDAVATEVGQLRGEVARVHTDMAELRQGMEIIHESMQHIMTTLNQQQQQQQQQQQEQ